MKNKIIFSLLATPLIAYAFAAAAKSPFDDFQARPPLRVHRNSPSVAVGLTPVNIKAVYNLPSTGGTGTIAIVDAYDDPNIASDLNVFSKQYNLPQCNAQNPCFEKKMMAAKIRADSGWALEESLDVEWAHAIAPQAKILLVEAKSASGSDLLDAVDYARGRGDVVAVSMSWGGGEFSTEPAYDFHFMSPYGAAFFAASGDSGNGVEWPAVSSNVTGVGGTTLNFDSKGQFLSETAWSKSGGGVSLYETAPAYQSSYGIANAGGMRAVPDVSYDADPASGVSVYDSFTYQGTKGWFEVGGTSAGAPQWAAIRALGGTAANSMLYHDATANYAFYFRDILSGTNGTCNIYCTAGTGYDYVTGLGSPVVYNY